MEAERLLECLSWESEERTEPEDPPPGHRLFFLSTMPSTLRTCDLQIFSGVKDLVSIEMCHGPYPDVTCGFIEHLDLSSIHTLRFDNVPLRDPFLFELENRRQQGTLGEITVFRSRHDWFSADTIRQTVARWTSLRRLSLNGRCLTPGAVRALEGLRKLSVLDVTLAQPNEQLLQEMRQALPGCEVYVHGHGLG